MSESGTLPPSAGEPVLSTLNRDGSRRRIRPRLATGRFLTRRRVVGYFLILLFTAIPYLRLGGKPLVLLDVPRREFVLFGRTFLPTDTMLLMLLLVSVFLGIFLLTALFGRVWCGWACPQTVYMELVYRPIERLLEGPVARQMKLDREGADARRMIKGVVYVFVSAFLAHTFLAYFVGIERLLAWVRLSPFEHPQAFAIMAVTTAAMLLDFGWFREQVCLVACPYGRLQAVLLDRDSLIVGYDTRRGEPRAKLRRGVSAGAGDCVDCGACVATCPTGIDIRNGLQMECIGCTQCIDACDAIMDRLGRARGLIRYASRRILEARSRRLLRPRVVIYPLLLAASLAGLGLALAEKESADVTILRGIGGPFVVLPSGEISNQLRVKIVNRSGADRIYALSLAGPATALRLVSPQNPLAVRAGHFETATVFVIAPREAFRDGRRELSVSVSDGESFTKVLPYRLLGPQS